jgi:hypothetical protein
VRKACGRLRRPGLPCARRRLLLRMPRLESASGCAVQLSAAHPHTLLHVLPVDYALSAARLAAGGPLWSAASDCSIPSRAARAGAAREQTGTGSSRAVTSSSRGCRLLGSAAEGVTEVDRVSSEVSAWRHFSSLSLIRQRCLQQPDVMHAASSRHIQHDLNTDQALHISHAILVRLVLIPTVQSCPQNVYSLKPHTKS